jgi:hypothetical protein
MNSQFPVIALTGLKPTGEGFMLMSIRIIRNPHVPLIF